MPGVFLNDTPSASAYEQQQRTLRELIGTAPMAPVQVLVVMVCFLLNMIDGMDVLILSYVAPVLADEWTLNAREVGWMFSAGLLGMTIGCLGIAPLADILGRRRMLLISTSVIAVGMLLSASATSLVQMISFRSVTGLGIGSLLPSLAAMAAEFSNEKRRDLSVGFVQAGWPIGAIITGVLAAWLVPRFGWRSMFVGAAGISALMIPVIAFRMPESLELLGRRQPRNAAEQMNRLLVQMRHEPLATLAPRPAGLDDRARVGGLFEKSLASSTLFLWAGVFFGFMTLYTLISWVPSVAKSAGLPVAQAIYVGTLLNVGAFAGSTSIGWLSIRFGLRRLIPAYFVIAIILLVSYANLPLSATVMFVMTFLIGVTVQGGFNGFYPAAASIYPTGLRATGIGWAMGAGRTGAILGPLIAGYLLDAGLSTSALFVIFCAPLALSGVAAYLIPSRSLQ